MEALIPTNIVKLNMANQSTLHIYCIGGVLFLLFVINVGQYTLGLGSGSVNTAYEFGFPFSYYEYVPMLSRGRVLYLGLVGNTLAGLGMAVVTAILISKWRRSRSVL